MTALNSLLAIVGVACLGVSAGYAVLSLLAVIVWRMQKPAHAPDLAPRAPVTILKPLCGAEPGLYGHLRSFCRQDYPEYQITFGVRDPADPALDVVKRLICEFPSLPIDVTIDSRQHGYNYKNSNLINMLAKARHDILVIADSDTWVSPDYLATVTAPLFDPEVGLVTCMYRDIPTPRGWSRLGAMYVNEWYAPSVLLAWLFGHKCYASGQTLCLRRDTLKAIGGLEAIANHLADDYRLGELIRAQGLRIVLSPYEIYAEHDETDLASLTMHERRWMRTIRVLRPRSFRMIFLSFSLPMAISGLLLTLLVSPASATTWPLFAVALSARIALHFQCRMRSNQPLFSDFWLVPVRDWLIVWVWCRAFFTSRITWRGSEFDVDSQGVMHRVASGGG